MRTPTPRRLSLLRGSVIAVCSGFLAVTRAVDGQWWWFALALAVCAWSVTDLVRTLRRSAAEDAALATAREQAEAEAVARWSVHDLRELRAVHGVDTSTGQGRVALIKLLRQADPRLGLVAAKNLVDGLEGRPAGPADPS